MSKHQNEQTQHSYTKTTLKNSHGSPLPTIHQLDHKVHSGYTTRCPFILFDDQSASAGSNNVDVEAVGEWVEDFVVGGECAWEEAY